MADRFHCSKLKAMKEEIISLKKRARLAGLLYLAVGVLGFYAMMFVPRRIFVRGDTIASANNLLTNEFLFRTSILTQLASAATFSFLAFVLYRLFKKVNKHQAKTLVALVLVQVPVIFLLETFDLTALMILKGQVFKTVAPAQLRELSLLFVKVHGYGISTLEIFWGVWLIPLSQLVYKSVFIPRVLGILLLLAGIGYMVDSITFTLFPDYGTFTHATAFILSVLGEGSTILWLLIIGVKDHLSITVISESDVKPSSTRSLQQRPEEYSSTICPVDNGK